MKIAVIGTGRMGKALSKTLSAVFDNVIFSGRDLEKTKETVAVLNCQHLAVMKIDDAIKEADMVIPALWFKEEKVFAEKYRYLLAGKIYLNISVPFNDTFDDFVLPFGVSAAETIHAIVPETLYATGFKNTFWTVFENPVQTNRLKSDVFINSDDEKTGNLIVQTLNPLPFRFIKAGPVSENRTIERMTLLARNISKREGFYPRVSWHIWGKE